MNFLNHNSSQQEESRVKSYSTMLISIFAFFVIVKFIVPFLQLHFFTVATTPTIDAPNNLVQTGSLLSTSELLDAPYIPPQNPFADSEYSKVPRVVYGGNFKEAQLIIHGSVLTPENYFLVLNFANDGGMIKAVRSSINRLDVGKTASLGGLFTLESGIEATVNLMSDNLGTIQSEFQRTGSGSRIFHFLKTKQKNEVSPIIAIPFSNSGQYGGAVISSIQIQYSCESGKKCLIQKCKNSKKYSQCIKDAFGVAAMNEWLKEHQYSRQ